jgi:hypothetical protein
MKSLLACAAAVLFASCVNDPVPYDSTSYALDMQPGDNRVMLRQIAIDRGDSTARFYGIQEIVHEKDTVFNGHAGRIFTVTATDLYRDTVQAYPARVLIVQEGDSLYEYVFKGGAVIYLAGLLKGAALDTAAFSQRTLHALFPLQTGKPWRIAPDEEELELTKEYLGRENVSFGGKKYACAVFVLHGLEGTPIKTWVSSLGVLKADVDYPEYTPEEAPSPVRVRETYRLLRVNASASEIAALKAEYQAKSGLSGF